MKTKKLTKLIISLCLLTAISLLFGCTTKNVSGKEAVAQAGSTSYEEMILNEPLNIKDISPMNMNRKNQIVFYRNDEKKLVFLGDDGKVTKETSVDLEGNVLFDFDKDNNIYVLVQDKKKDDSGEITLIKRQLVIYDGEGKKLGKDDAVKELKPGNGKLKDEIITKIAVDSKGNIYAHKLDRTLEVFDTKLNSIDKIEEKEYFDIAIDENDNLIVLYMGENMDRIIEKLDAKSRATVWKKEYKGLEAPSRNIYYNKNTKLLYGLNEKNIIKYGEDGSKNDKLLEYTDISVVEYSEDFAVDDNEQIYLLAQNGDESKLIKYVKSNKKASARKELVLEVFLDIDNALSNAAREFEKQHPDVKIKIVDCRGIPYEEYGKRKNTELMTGKGSDIFCDYSNPGDYIKKGFLVNFDEMIKNDKEVNLNDYCASILNGSRRENGLYSLPLTYSFDALLVNEKLLKENDIVLQDNWTWKDFYDIAKRIKVSKSGKRNYMLPKLINEWIPLDSMIFQDIDYYIDSDKKVAKFNTKEFIDTLKLYQALKKEDVIHPAIDEFAAANPNSKSDVDNILFIPVTIDSYHQISYYGRCFDDSFRIVPMPKGQYENTRYFSGKNIYVNNSSKYKKEAWEFIKYLLSEKVQLKLGESDFALNKKAMDAQIKEIFKYQAEHKRKEEHAITDSDIAQVDHLINDIVNNNRADTEISQIIWKELELFMQDKKGAEETAKAIQNKAELYIKE